ncbi:MAG: hypothetical protein HQL94_02870 [Magnetococcales bacterium]|nr:hypothetical protein [Magnetococcales bacterium]MBF0437781.1 hypothetical protein [Magnetococcales bacterium]
MTAVLIALLLLILLFWVLLKLRALREKKLIDEKPADKYTILLGLYYVLSRACLHYYRDRNSYPKVVSGSVDGLMELGYLKGETLADTTNALKLFSIITTDKDGCGICLAHIKASMAHEIINRVSEARVPFHFQDFKGGQLKPLDSQGDTLVNLTLPLPVRPVGSTPNKVEDGGQAQKSP